jgi:CheY-like chemotaxis protein
MNPVKILIVEDDALLLAELSDQYRRIFAERDFVVEITAAVTVAEARKLAKQGRSSPFDLVSLDVNLGDTDLTGLDVLETLHRFRSAWMVALLTGVETDASFDARIGTEKAGDIRRKLRREAYSRFPAERLLVVEKPSSTLALMDSRHLLSNRLEQIALVYEEVGRLRYVFRPIEVSSLERIPQPKGSKGPRKFIDTTSLHWQIRYNCGEIRTLPNLSGFKTLHYLLSRDRNVSITPEEALSIEPKAEKSSLPLEAGEDPVATYFESQGIAWKELSQLDQDKLIRAALSLKFNRYCELRGFQDDDDLSISEESELNRIIRDLGPLATTAETGYLRTTPGEVDPSIVEESSSGSLAQDDLHIAGGNYDNLGEGRKGKDSPAAQLFRARMKRVRDCLRENGFADLAQHLEDYIMSTGANWSYNPPEEVEWTT